MISFVCFAPNARADNDFSINSLRIGTHDNGERLVLDLSDKAKFRVFILKDPTRIVIDLPRFTWRVKDTRPASGKLIGQIRNGMLQKDISRIVMETSGPVSIKDAFLLPAAENLPNRLVIDILPADKPDPKFDGKIFGELTSEPGDAPPRHTQEDISGKIVPTPSDTGPHTLRLPPRYQPPRVNGDEEDQATKPAVRQPQRAAASAETEKPAPARRGKKLVIVIDPGHGGQDPGSPGINGTQEKDVTLAAARELARQLSATGRYDVRLTRSSDIFIKLPDRVAIGRAQGADLFISLHADSIDRRNVSGASIYTLSNTASDAQTAKLASRENRADLISGVDLSHEDKEVAGILIDLAMRDTMNQSKYFANLVVREAGRHGIELLERPHRFAGFAVLKAPDIPSVLIEMGFMSNPREVAQLNSDNYRRKLAGTIVSGIDDYFGRIRPARD